MYLHFQSLLNADIVLVIEVFLMGDKDLIILHNLYHHGCWWRGFLCYQGIRSRVIDLVILKVQFNTWGSFYKQPSAISVLLNAMDK